MEIVRSERADEDLIDIWLAVARNSEAAADRVIDSIVGRWEQLARHPYSGPGRDDIAADVRHLLAGQYLTLYRVEPEAIRILRVLHGHRQIGRMRFPNNASRLSHSRVFATSVSTSYCATTAASWFVTVQSQRTSP